MKLFIWIRNRWYARLRRLDIELIWPIFKERAQDIELAKAIFSFHAFHSYNWIVLSDEELVNIIDSLE